MSKQHLKNRSVSSIWKPAENVYSDVFNSLTGLESKQLKYLKKNFALHKHRYGMDFSAF